MALIDCPECRKQVSSTAKTCPGCGYQISKPVNATQPKPRPLKVKLIIIIAMGVAAYFTSRLGLAIIGDIFPSIAIWAAQPAFR